MKKLICKLCHFIKDVKGWLVAIFILFGMGFLAYCYIDVVHSANVTPQEDYTRLAVANVATQVVLSLLTFVAVCVSLWMAGLKLLFQRPKIRLISANDKLHCILENVPTDLPMPIEKPYLDIYAHLENLSSIAAEGCRITCNKIYVSVDGSVFHLYKIIQTASFNWTYASKDEPYLAIIRKSVERFCRIMKILQQSTVEAGADGNASIEIKDKVESSGNVSWIEIYLPERPGAKGTIVIPTRYCGVLLPLTVVSKSTEERTFFLKVVWHGDKVEKYEQAGFLEVDVLSDEDAASKLIAKEGRV